MFVYAINGLYFNMSFLASLKGDCLQTQDVNYAMEASRKSRLAFAAANVRKEEAQYREGISSVKTALDFSFQDVEGLLHLVRVAMEAIGR